MLKKIIFKLFKNKSDHRNFTKLEKYNKKYKKIIEDINHAIKHNKELNFLHSGHCGDLIYSFAVIKRLSLSIMLIISSLLAIPLSLRMAKIGRFTMILSGLVIFLTYYGLVQGQKILVFESSFSSFQVFSISHFIFVTIWLLLFGLEQYRFELGNFMMARNSKKFFIQAFFLTALVFFLLNILYFNF